MIQDLQGRATFWTEYHRAHWQGDSIQAPFKCLPNWKDIIQGSRVLEIGPGEGRQFKELASLASGYTIADIAPRVLENPAYESAGKHLIASYVSDNIGERFDVVCFWYVLHHVLRSEGVAFFRFIERHLAEDGEVLFNTPSKGQVQGLSGPDGNGVETTPWHPDEVMAMLAEVGLHVVRSEELAPNCLVIHARRGRSVPGGAAGRKAEISLNLGGGKGWAAEQWTNLEQDLGYDMAREGLKRFGDGSVARIFCSHSLEHIPIEAARRLMRDAHRVLRPGGVLRLVLPDAEKFVRAWRDGNSTFYGAHPYLPMYFESELDCLMHMGGNPDNFDAPSKIGHWFFWDRYSLTWLLVCSGFRIVRDSAFGESFDPEMREVATMDPVSRMPVRGFDNPLTRSVSVYIEAVR